MALLSSPKFSDHLRKMKKVAPHIVCFVLLYTFSVVTTEDLNPFSDAFIENINFEQSSWHAGRNFPVHMTVDKIKYMMGAFVDFDKHDWEYIEHEPESIENLPINFDPRYKWRNCPTLREIRDQGCCGSCWTFGAVEAMSDRYCIHSNGRRHFHFSAQDLLGCCSSCSMGCEGGHPKTAWEYWVTTGIVSGGNYNSSRGCSPYLIPKCKFDSPGDTMSCGRGSVTPTCTRKCRKGYRIPYEQDKKYGKRMYLIKNDENQIKSELFWNGPVEATFAVYADFGSYKSGVYRHVKGALLAYHAVKVLGWGIENGNKYWLVANSWGRNWGANGYFKISRGDNQCGIESSIVAGIPSYR